MKSIKDCNLLLSCLMLVHPQNIHNFIFRIDHDITLKPSSKVPVHTETPSHSIRPALCIWRLRA
ncbi:MAG: hypothetical protein LBQ74_10140 [Prevotella sp.]|nr:hypothetical protein [Prevotella sp.]